MPKRNLPEPDYAPAGVGYPDSWGAVRCGAFGRHPAHGPPNAAAGSPLDSS